MTPSARYASAACWLLPCLVVILGALPVVVPALIYLLVRS